MMTSFAQLCLFTVAAQSPPEQHMPQFSPALYSQYRVYTQRHGCYSRENIFNQIRCKLHVNTRLHSSYFVRSSKQSLANNTKVLKLYLASLLPTVQDDNIQESMETFLSTVQEPFYLLQRSIQEFHNIRGASKNSIMTGSPPPLFPMRRPPCPLMKTLPRSGAMITR